MLKELRHVKVTMTVLLLLLVATTFIILNLSAGMQAGLTASEQVFGFLAIAIMIVICVLQFTQIERVLSIERASSTDVTGIQNKSAFEDRMEKLNAMDSSLGVALISFDLNNLKKTNDTYGHVAGDLMIKSFATALANISSAASVYRTGGDEFVVVMENATEDMVKDFCRKLEEKTNAINEKGKVNLSYAQGYAISLKNNYSTPDELREISDQNMYERKQYMKAHGLCNMR
ncbi:MAG: GGDEF domain-containing protein [Lachnospiraceae bacterium]|nr:GGDEF domain-containing protein [Lachnospiraceae bacterium]